MLVGVYVCIRPCMWVALPLTPLLPRVQPEFTVSPTPLNVCWGRERETYTHTHIHWLCVCVCLQFSLQSHLCAHKVMTVWRETISVCSHVYLCVAQVCMCAFVTDVRSLMTRGSVMLLPLSVCFIACHDIMVSALFPAITQVKDVWCVTNYITFFLRCYSSIQPANYIEITRLLSSCSCSVLPPGRCERGEGDNTLWQSDIEKVRIMHLLRVHTCVYWA